MINEEYNHVIISQRLLATINKHTHTHPFGWLMHDARNVNIENDIYKDYAQIMLTQRVRISSKHACWSNFEDC